MVRSLSGSSSTVVSVRPRPGRAGLPDRRSRRRRAATSRSRTTPYRVTSTLLRLGQTRQDHDQQRRLGRPPPRPTRPRRHRCVDRSAGAAHRFGVDVRSDGSVALVDRVLGGDRVGVYRRSSSESVSFTGYRFPPDVILLAVRWYLRYGLSYREMEELLAERGIDVDHVTIYRWVQRFTPLLMALLHWAIERECRPPTVAPVGHDRRVFPGPPPPKVTDRNALDALTQSKWLIATVPSSPCLPYSSGSDVCRRSIGLAAQTMCDRSMQQCRRVDLADGNPKPLDVCGSRDRRVSRHQGCGANG
jgi:hypothetical protein